MVTKLLALNANVNLKTTELKPNQQNTLGLEATCDKQPQFEAFKLTKDSFDQPDNQMRQSHYLRVNHQEKEAARDSLSDQSY
ncbi:hypothetical protein ACFFUS_06030 [Vibrio gallaecicus]|uniref:hypothetical protein n=1 Tax=Vibrio TaxID=662 RepID=UPI0010CA1D31|nr:hypothetical protein [Vibrio gallaecicus]MDN3617501.1 hypothetical protein [Vibrio gallaecicus]